MSFATADDIDISGNPYAVNGANMTLSSSAYSGVPFSTNNFPIQDTTFNWWACCTEYSVAVFALISGTYQAMYVGALKNPASLNTSGVSTATGTLASSGSNVTIPLAVDITSNLQVGQQIGILNQSHSYSSSHFGAFERQAIVSLSGGASPTVTVTSLTNSYDTGALVGNIPQNMTCSAQTGSVSGTMYMTRNNNFTYSSGTAQTGTFDTGILSSINSYNSPTGSASLNGGKWAGEVDGAIYQTTGAYQGISGFLIGLQYFGYGGVSALDYFSDLPLVWKIFLSASTCSCGIGPLVNAQNTLTSVGWVP
jgi:hypothetical protein